MGVAGVVLAVVLAFIVGKWYGWVQAHHVVATECERLVSSMLVRRFIVV